jgi:hypothetical protein
LAAGLSINVDKNGQGSFRVGPVESLKFDMRRPRVYRLTLDDGRCADIQTLGFHLIDNSGTNFVSFRLLNSLGYHQLPTPA